VKEDALTVASKAARFDSNGFAEWIDDRLRAVSSILDTVKDEVSNDRIEPLVAARIASCVAGSSFGYEEFHPRGGTPPAEQLLEALSPHDRGLAESTRP
jgi:hypothetical protein